MDAPTFAVLTSLLAAGFSHEPAVGVVGGKCHISNAGHYELCQRSVVWEKYVRGAYYINENLRFVNVVSSLSSWDGKADIVGDAKNQSGHVVFVGYGLEWRF